MPLSSDPIPDGARALAARFPAPRADVGELFALSRSATAAPDDLVRSLARSPLVALRFVRLANASFWSAPCPANGLARAIEQVGRTATPYVALVLAVSTALGDAERAGVPGLEPWTRRAWTRAMAALTLARRARAPFEPEAFACGFLLGIGRLALDLARAGHGGEPARAFADAAALGEERAASGCDRLQVEAALFEAWVVPSFLRTVLARVTRSGGAAIPPDEDLGRLAEAVALAEATVSLFERADKGRALSELEERARAAFDLTPVAVYDHLSELDGCVREARAALEPTGGAGPLLRASEGTPRGARGTLPPILEHRRMIPTDATLRDPECGVAGREAFDRFLDREIQARLTGAVTRPMCVLVLSVEGWPQVHRERGAAAAASWMREASRALASRVRRGDLFARLGGSYFGVCMSEAEPHAMELLTARLRGALAGEDRERAGRATSAAFGGACLAKALHPDDGRELLRTGVRLLKEALEERGGTRLLPSPISPWRAA